MEESEQESDGNYEGSEEENVKTKDKLINNLFTEKENSKFFTVIEDLNETETKSEEQKSDL